MPQATAITRLAKIWFTRPSTPFCSWIIRGRRKIQAAVSAPSASNRQPWRFHVVSAAAARRAIAEAVEGQVREMEEIIARGHHREDYAGYGDFFHEPLQQAAVLIVPTFRTFPDLIANLIRSGGGDPAQYGTAAAMQSELCSTAAACMNLLIQAQAEGLGACWMAGPMVAQRKIEALLGVRPPFRMLGAVALGWPAEQPAPKPRKPEERVVEWIEDI